MIIDRASVRIHGENAKLFPCAAGHLLRGGWQTTDLRGLKHALSYELFDGKLYRCEVPEATEEVDVRLERSALLIGRRTLEKAPLCAHTGVVHIYTRCPTCRPVVYAVRSSVMCHAMIEVRQPWVEYGIKFVDGGSVEVKAVKVETRQDVVRELKSSGVQVLDDDSHLARQVFEQDIPAQERDLASLVGGRL